MNKILNSLKLSANALDWYGDPVADGTIDVTGLSSLDPDTAIKYYNEIKDLILRLRKDVKKAKKEQRIKELEDELNKLKDD